MNSKTNWELQIDPSVYKSLKRIPVKDKKRILSFFSELEINPYSGDIAKIKNQENIWRRRIGSYRIFFEIYLEEKVVHVFHVERRTTTTY